MENLSKTVLCRNCGHNVGIEKELHELWTEIESKIMKEVRNSLTLTMEELRSSLDFLRLRFDNEKPDGIVKADIAFSVQDPVHQCRTDVLYAHKFILASKSPVFCKMFKANMLKSETGLVQIDDATLPVMRAVIGFCYNAEIDFTDKVTFEEVLQVAHKYGIDLLVQMCEERLIQRIDKANLPRMLKLARMFEAKRLQAGALEYLQTHLTNSLRRLNVEVGEAV